MSEARIDQCSLPQSEPAKSPMNRLVTGIVATLMISVTVAWWVLLAQGATWLVSNWIARSEVVEASSLDRNTPLPKSQLQLAGPPVEIAAH